MRFLIFILICSLADTCNIVCLQDGADNGYIINNKCYCGNFRDLARIPTRLNRNITTNTQEKTLYGGY